MKVCCSSRSHARTLGSGGLTQLEWIDVCANVLTLDGVDLSAAHFPRTDGDYLAQIKKLCVDRWLTIAGISADAPLGSGDVEAQTVELGRWVEVGAALGAPLMRIECAPASPSPAVAWRELIRGLKELSARAKLVNVTLALQPKEDTLVATPHDARRVLKESDSAWLRLAIPAAQLGTDISDGWLDLMNESVIVVAKMRRLDAFGADEIFDYRRSLAALGRARYRGFLSLEYEGEEAEAQAVGRATGWLRAMLAKDELKNTAMEA